MFLTWSSFNNIRMLLMAFMPVIIFYLVWLVNTSERIRSEEGTLLDLICWPDGNVIPAIIACGSIAAIVIELYGLYQLFKAGLPKREYNVTSGLFYFIWALIVIIIVFLGIMFYSGLQSTIIRAKIKGGITKAMFRYASHLPSKVAIDRLQTHFHCCGRENYREWFIIPWETTEHKPGSNVLFSSNIRISFVILKIRGLVHVALVSIIGQNPRSIRWVRKAWWWDTRSMSALIADNTELSLVRKFVADNVPYSCCSMNAMWPCIHHGVTHEGTLYKYNPTKQLTIWTDGCEEKLISEMMSVSWRFNAVMALIIMAMILQIIAVRYLHTAYNNGLHVGNKITCNAYLLRSIITDTESEGIATRKVFKRRKTHKARTLEWVMAKYRPKSKYTTSSGSDFNSSDELLKPMYE